MTVNCKKMLGVVLGLTILAVAPAAASAKCVVKAAEGTGSDAKSAKFQVDEALLQAVDWGAWAAWMANGSTPGYKFGARTYKCSKGGMGIVCRGQAKICKL
ncbi:MAG: hypothetical protein AB7E80_01440 [Hyphomicrobiaceae bacterium]